MISFGVITRYLRRLRSFSRNARLYLAGELIIGLGASIYSLFFNLYVVSQGYPRSFLGELQALPSLIALFGAVPAGVLVDHIGRKNALVFSNVVHTLATLGVVLAPSPNWLRLTMIVYGVSWSLWMVSSSPFLVENSTPDERDTLFSAHFGLTTLVGFAGTLVGGFLPSVFGGLWNVDIESPVAYGATMGVTVLLFAISAIPVLMIKEGPRPKTAQARSFLPWRNVRSPKTAVRIFLPNIIISMGAAILIPYMNLFFKETFEIQDRVLGVVFAVSSVVTGVATLASPLLADRWGRIRSLVATQLLSIPFLLATGFVPVFWVAAGAYWVRAALMNMSSPLYEAFAMEQVTEGERATVSGLMGMSWNIGWTIGPYLSGYMQEAPGIGFPPIFLITCSLYVLAAVLEKTFFQRIDDEQRRAAFLQKKGIVDMTPRPK